MHAYTTHCALRSIMMHNRMHEPLPGASVNRAGHSRVEPPNAGPVQVTDPPVRIVELLAAAA